MIAKSRLEITPENQIINCIMMFGINSKKPKNLNAETTNTSANTSMYAKENNGTQIRFVSQEKKEICPKYKAKIGEIASVVETSIASAFERAFGILHF